MSVVEATIGGIIADKISEKLKPLIDDINKEKVVIVKSDANKLVKTRLIRLTATSSTKTTQPTGTIQSPVDEEGIITNISLIPDSSFQTSGMLQIEVNEVELFKQNAVGDFGSVPVLDIDLRPEGKEIKRNGKTDFYLWGIGSMTIFIHFERKKVD